MGMSSGGGGGRFGRSALSEINVTPLVDVMLVLLIIFMVTAPMTKTGIDLDLPKTKKVKAIKQKISPLEISISKNQGVYIGKKKVKLSELSKYITKKTKSAKIEADERAPYGVVAKVLSKVKNLGINEISLITEEN